MYYTVPYTELSSVKEGFMKINVQVKLSPDTVEKINSLRGPELGWAQSAVVRELIEEALAYRFFLSHCSVCGTKIDKPNKTKEQGDE